MKNAIVHGRQEHVPQEMLLSWASFFSSAPGTCFLHTPVSRTSPHDDLSLLFLLPRKNAIAYENSFLFDDIWNSTPLYGAISYDFGSPYTSPHDVKEPLFALFSPSLWALYHTSSQTLSMYYYEECYDHFSDFFGSTNARDLFFSGGCSPTATIRKNGTPTTILSWQEKELFYKNVNTIRGLIHDGDMYQMNLSYEVSLQCHEDPFAIFYDLVTKNPSPQSAFFNINSDLSIISSSPERLLQRRGDHLLSQPIKGTRPRGTTASSDNMLLRELQTSPKERAELAMITDLIRNDLFPISKPGTLQLERPFHITSYDTVFQQHTDIVAQARERSPKEAILRMFPGGSITGCPKERSMKRIQEIEKRARGIYTGSIGYVLSDSCYDWNIAIRTLIAERSSSLVRFSVGAGIVWGSDPCCEYEETLHKAKSLALSCNTLPPYGR